MKTLLLILLIAISFHPRLPAQLSETGTAFSVMTYNIRYAGGEKEGDINNWSKRKYLVAKVITKYKPDIIGLQEAEKIQIDDLMNLSDGYNWIGVGRNDGKEAGEFTAIFYNKNRFELIRNLTFWLSETPGVPSRGWDAAPNRTVTVAELLDKKSGKSLYLFNTHFDHVGEKARIESVKLLVEKINENLPGLMELEYEGTFPAGIFVSAKQGPYGAKKKYALLDEKGNVRIKGFETVRRNWSFIAKEVQKNVLNIILKENDLPKAVKYVKIVIQDLRDKKIPNEKVIIHTQLQKNVDEYASVGPHVAVARRLKAKGEEIVPGTIIKYIITFGKGILRERARTPDELEEGGYDPDYYINNQIIPSVERIFEALGYKKEDLTSDKKQSALGDYF